MSRLPFQYVAVLAAVIGGIGFVFFGWRFGGETDLFPTALGIAFAGVAVLWTLYQQV